MTPELSRLRALLGSDPRHPAGDRLGTALTQIRLLDRRLDGADADTLAAFSAALRAVFPERFGDDLEDDTCPTN
jgi:hypothetical protein